MSSRKSVFFRTFILCFFIVAAVLLNVQPAAGFSVSDYFTISYQITLSTSEVHENQTFNATVSGSGTCKAQLPVSVSSATISSRIVATNQATGTKVTLNAGYTLTISPFPNTVGQTQQLTQAIPLTFPAGSPAGTYTVTGELIDAKVTAIIGIDVSSYFPSSQTIGTVNYILNNSNPIGGGGGASTTSTTTTTTSPTTTTTITTTTTTTPVTTTSQPSTTITSTATPTTTTPTSATTTTTTTTTTVITTSQSPTTTTPPPITSTPSGPTPGTTSTLKPGPASKSFNWWWLVSFTVVVIAGTVMLLIVRRSGDQ